MTDSAPTSDLDDVEESVFGIDLETCKHGRPVGLCARCGPLEDDDDE